MFYEHKMFLFPLKEPFDESKMAIVPLSTSDVQYKLCS